MSFVPARIFTNIYAMTFRQAKLLADASLPIAGRPYLVLHFALVECQLLRVQSSDRDWQHLNDPLYGKVATAAFNTGSKTTPAHSFRHQA